jgi:quinoprotein glucose dehydrogenase
VKFVSKYKIGPLFTPPVVSKVEGPLGTLMLPSAGGGANWAGGAYDPESHTVYVYSQTTPTSLGLVPAPAGNDFGWVSGNAATAAAAAAAQRGAGPGGQAGAPGQAGAAPAGRGRGGAEGGEGGGGNALNVRGLPLIKPPYGRITAIDLNKGDIAWQIAHGETPDNVRNHADLKGLTIPRTGQTGVIGTLVTKTLIIAGERQFTTTADHPRGAMLRAYNKASGQEVGAVFMPAPQTGSPMTLPNWSRTGWPSKRLPKMWRGAFAPRPQA